MCIYVEMPYQPSVVRTGSLVRSSIPFLGVACIELMVKSLGLICKMGIMLVLIVLLLERNERMPGKYSALSLAYIKDTQ